MNELAKRIAGLSPEQRKQFEELLAAEKTEAASLSIPPAPQRGSGSSFPLSFAQERVWFLETLEPGTALYNIPVAVHLRGRLVIGALEESFRQIIRRHESLRTHVTTLNGQGVQVISPNPVFGLVEVDLRDVPATDRESEIQRRATQEARRPFDLDQAPLFRVTLLCFADDQHILLITLHHIVADGWSIGVLFRELAQLYAAYATGSPAALPSLSVQYSDYAEWQRQRLQGSRLGPLLAYWKQRLQDASAVLELPIDHPRPPVQTYSGALQTMVLSQTLSRDLQELAAKENATLFMVLLAAFKILLARYTGQDDIVVGTAIAARTCREIEGLIGFFVNTLALRTDLSGNPAFRELLGRVRDTTLGAYEHQDLPFEKLVAELRPERRLSHSPLFQVLLLFQNVPMEPEKLAGLEVTPLEINNGTAKFDLSLAVIEKAEGLRLGLTYNTDLFQRATVQRMLVHFRTLLERIVTSPDRRLSDLPILTAPERRQLLTEWNDTSASFSSDKCIHHLFEQQVERTPEAIAVSFENQRITYRELNRRANQLARYLRQRGVGPEVLVGIYVERSVEMMIGLLGILKAGGAYVPMDPSYPRERLGYIVEDARMSLLLTQQHLREALPAHQAEVIFLDADATAIEREKAENLPALSAGHNLAYVIFTSGSTGRPKGVAIMHRGVVNLLIDMQKHLQLIPADVFPALASFSFDMCIPELYLPLTVGAQVLVVDRETAADGRRLLAHLIDKKATIVHATPTTWHLLLEAGWRGEPHFKMAVGAEALPPELATRLIKIDQALFHFYGPTETTVWSTMHQFRSPDEHVSVGRPLANTQIYILDRHLRPVSVGVPGELYIGGVGLARGYLNRPELTVEKFVPNPFDVEKGSRLYRTGDLARYRQGGTIDFLGRADHQVKIRGFRIELGEIEEALSRHPAVSEGAVIVREDEAGDKRLVAYVVPAQGQTPKSKDLRRHLRDKLPDYMIPNVFMFLDALPLSPNGKINRQALPAPDQDRPELDGSFVAPRNPVEEAIAGLWAEILRLNAVGVHDNFFELGGHSLLAMRLNTRLRDTFQVEIPLRSIFENPTVAGIADRILKSLLKDMEPEAMALLEAEIEG